MYFFMLFTLLFNITSPNLNANTTFLQTAKPETAVNQDAESMLMQTFLQPLDFSDTGITKYFKYIYNNPAYADFIAHDLSHMIQLLEYGKQSSYNEAYAKSVLQIFSQKIKTCSYVNAYNFLDFSRQVGDLLKIYITRKEETLFQTLQKQIKTHLNSMFSNYFSVFKKEPDKFLETIAEQVVTIKTEETQSHQVSIEQLKKDLVRFFELCIGKLVWAPDQADDAWLCINALAQEAFTLYELDLISDPETYNDLCWSLVSRFCYFLELNNDTLTYEQLDKISMIAQTEKLLLLEADEAEDLLESKKDFLLTKIRQFKQGKLPAHQNSNEPCTPTVEASTDLSPLNGTLAYKPS